MASFDNHIDQAKDNLSFLLEANNNNPKRWGWQVVVCFYTAVHIVNAHLARVANLHYRTHEDTKNALSSSLSTARIPPAVYLAYTKLEGLSRRARYLCHDEATNRSIAGFFTREKHLAKALMNLDIVLEYFQGVYSLNFGSIELICGGMERYPTLKVLTIKKEKAVVPVVEMPAVATSSSTSQQPPS